MIIQIEIYIEIHKDLLINIINIRIRSIIDTCRPYNEFDYYGNSSCSSNLSNPPIIIFRGLGNI